MVFEHFGIGPATVLKVNIICSFCSPQFVEVNVKSLAYLDASMARAVKILVKTGFPDSKLIAIPISHVCKF